VILDATAFYADVPFSSLATYYSTQSVIEEVSHKKIRKAYIDGLIETGRLRIYFPSEQYFKRVKEVASKSGDVFTLSKTDVSVVALALEFMSKDDRVIIVSDDHAVENLAKTLGIKVVSVMTSGIKKIVKWKQYCMGCGKIFHESKKRECDVCGSTIKRKFENDDDLSQV
jgi:UPF0271 protein